MSYELAHYDQRTGSNNHEWLLLCILMILYIAKRLDPSFEFGRFRAPRSISLMRLDGTHGASPTCCQSSPWATGHRRRWKPIIMQTKRRKPPHYKGGTKNRPYQYRTVLKWVV